MLSSCCSSGRDFATLFTPANSVCGSAIEGLLHQQSGCKAKQTVGIWENSNDFRSPLDFFYLAFGQIGCSQFLPVIFRDVKYA